MRAWIFTLALSVLLSLPLSVQAMNLTGTWNCDDGGTYYLRQFGDELWWYGEQSPTFPTWSNIAHGRIEGDSIDLKWTDVPKGSLMNHGFLILEVRSGGRIVAVRKSGGFGGSVWTREGHWGRDHRDHR